MPFPKFSNEVQIINKRHGRKFNVNMGKTQFIGIISIANGAKMIPMKFTSMAENATARAAVPGV